MKNLGLHMCSDSFYTLEADYVLVNLKSQLLRRNAYERKQKNADTRARAQSHKFRWAYYWLF